MLTHKLPPNVHKRLTAAARQSGKTVDAFAVSAIMHHLNDIEDEHVARQRLAQGGARISHDELEAELAART